MKTIHTKIYFWNRILSLILFTSIPMIFAEQSLMVFRNNQLTHHFLNSFDSVTYNFIETPDAVMVIDQDDENFSYKISEIDSIKVQNITRFATITVAAGDSNRSNTLVKAILSLPSPANPPFQLVEVIGNQRVYVASQFKAPNELWWVLSGITEAGTLRVFELEKFDADIFNPEYSIEINAGFIDINQNNSLALKYLTDSDLAKGYKRSGYISEAYSPEGTLMTESGALDHAWHKAIFFNHTHVEFEGRTVNFWWDEAGMEPGRILFDSLLSQWEGPIFSGFSAMHNYIEVGTQKNLLREQYDLQIINTKSSGTGAHLFDLTITQWLASQTPVKILPFEFTGMAYRGAAEWTGANISILTSENISGDASLKTRAKWTAISGNTNGKWKSAIIMSHNSNYEFPEFCMNYMGLRFIGFAPFQQRSLEMIPGKKYVYKYRFFLHEGNINTQRYNDLWFDFGNPPIVDVTPIR